MAVDSRWWVCAVVGTSRSVRWRGDCAGDAQAGYGWCRGSSGFVVVNEDQVATCDRSARVVAGQDFGFRFGLVSVAT